MVKTVIFMSVQRISHLFRDGSTVPVLEWPHTLLVEERNTVFIFKGGFQVRLNPGHGAQFAIDKGDPSFLRCHVQFRQEITHRRSRRNVKLQMSIAALRGLSRKPCQVTV